MKIIGEPGHYKGSGSDSGHFLGRCGECDAHYMAGMTLAEAEYRYHGGFLSDDQIEAFRHVWQTSALRLAGRYVSYASPRVGEVAEIAEAIRSALPTAAAWNEAWSPGDGSI